VSALRVTVVTTVVNEAGSVERLLDSLAGQTRRPDEVVVLDGGSSDGTWEVLEARAAHGDLPLIVLREPGANISRGRNLAIGRASGPVIACTDAGVRLSPGWLAAITAPFERGARFVAGSFESDPHGAFETALGATTLPERSEIDPRRFLPSSRSVAYARDDAQAVGGYPEWLDYCEDLVFDLRLAAFAGPPVFVPEAVVRFAPRGHLRAFATQYVRYARGDGKADLWFVRHCVRYATYLMAIPALAWAAVAARPAPGIDVQPAAAVALAGGLGLMVARPYDRLRRQWGPLSRSQRLVAVAWVPVIRVVGDLAKMVGYPIGRLWRRAHRPPEWRPTHDVGRL
jgi:glycosyltransferase involved in cell wall biosynthesis